MNNVQLILALLPLANELALTIGNQIMKINTGDITKEDVLQALEESRSANWPDLKFESPVKDNG